MKLLKFTFIFIVFLQLTITTDAAATSKNSQSKEKEIAWQATTLSGEGVSLDEMLAYPKVVLMFWTTRCPRCKDDLKIMNKQCADFKDVKVFLVNIAESKRDIEWFSSYINLNQCIQDKIVLDREGKIERNFYIPGVPTYIFFKDGEPTYVSFFWFKSILEEVYKNE